MKKFRNRLISFAIVAFFSATACFMLLVGAAMDDSGRVESIEVPRGASLSQVAQSLYEARLIRSPLAFSLFGRLKNVSHTIRAGEYEFNSSMPPALILDKLVRGEIKGYMVTIPEGFTMSQVAEAIVEANLPRGRNFLKAAADRELLASLGVPARTAEGYLFPETYTFTRSMSEKEMVTLMIRQFRAKVKSLEEEARQSGMEFHKVVILASLIEKEAKVKEEKPLISAVFHNRLEKKMLLQCDPTAVYGVKDFGGAITKAHLLSRKNPYNTYVFKGLPPGPIANPGLDSIIAAIRPADVDYLYFVSRNNGSHQFSRDLPSHNRAVAKFRLNRGKQ